MASGGRPPEWKSVSMFETQGFTRYCMYHHRDAPGAQSSLVFFTFKGKLLRKKVSVKFSLSHHQNFRVFVVVLF